MTRLRFAPRTCGREVRGERAEDLPGIFRLSFLLLLALLMLTAPATLDAQCPSEGCRLPATPHPAVVRVVHAAGNTACLGSGTLVDSSDGRGTVLTCAHLFSGQVGRVTVTFPEGHRSEARVVAIDADWDLAALEVDATAATPVTLADSYPKPGDPLRSCGYGSDGRYWCNEGRMLGFARTPAMDSYETLELSGRAREGDSGGPVFNARGELVAVLWGTDGRTVDGTYSGRIRKFLARLFSRRPPESAGPSPNPGSLAQPTNPGTLAPPASLTPPASLPTDTSDGPLERLRQRVDGLAEHEQSFGQRIAVVEKASGLLPAFKARLDRVEAAASDSNLRPIIRSIALNVLEQQGPPATAALPALLAALGWTGPPSMAVVLAVRLLLSLLRRRLASSRESPATTSLSTAALPTSSSTSASAGRLNDDYAAQLARVFALSGRSPLADATLGREFDEELRNAETSSDAGLARWAQQLRQRVAKRLFRIHADSPLPAEPIPSQN